MQSKLKMTYLAPLMERLSQANDEFTRRYPGIEVTRQPVHNIYGGALSVKADAATLSEDEALRTGITLDELHGRSFAKIVENRLKEASSE